MKKIVIIANITAKEDRIGQVKAELLKLISPTRAEAGCLSYLLHQDNENPAHFIFVENWETRELWQDHIQSAHLQGFLEATKEDLAAFEVSETSLLA